MPHRRLQHLKERQATFGSPASCFNEAAGLRERQRLPVIELHRYGVVTLVVVLVFFGELYLEFFVTALLQLALLGIILKGLVMLLL